MGRASTTLLLASAGLALGVGGCWWLRDRAAPPPPVDDAAQDQPPLAPPGAPAGGPELATARPRVWVEVDTLGTIGPPPVPPPVRVRRGGQLVPVPVEIVGGPGQLEPAPVPVGGLALARLQLDGRVLYRTVLLPADGSEVELALGPELSLQGRVLDDMRRPVAGARVWTGGAPDDEVRTDVDGSFAVAVPGGAGIPVVVRADGLAWCHRLVDLAPGGGPCEVTLGKACQLAVQIVGEAKDLRGARVLVVPAGTSRTTELLQFPFFAQDLLQTFALDAQGSATIDGLPRDATLGVLATGPLLPATGMEPVELRGRTARLDLTAPASVVVAGVVMDAALAPLAGVRVWSRPEQLAARQPGTDRWLLPAGMGTSGLCTATSDDRGEFALAVAGPGGLVRVAVPGLASVTRRVAGAQDELRLVVPVWSAPTALRVPPPAAGTPWGVRVAPFAAGFAEVAADQVFVQALTPQLATLRVRVQAQGGRWSEARVAADCAVVGAFELSPALLGR